MKKVLPFIFALSIAPAIASDDGNFHIGVKTGSIDIDLSGVDASTPKGIVLGYQKGSWGGELEANFADIDVKHLGSRRSSDYRTMALYGTYRTEGDFYLKAKAGVLRQDIKTSFSKGNGTGFSGGIGAGARLGPVTLEAEFTILESDANFFSLGANYHF